MISLAIAVFTIVCYWMIYEKLGIAGWKCLIPFYNRYVLIKRIYCASAFVVYLIAEIVLIIGSSWMGYTAIFGTLGTITGFEFLGSINVANILIPIILIAASAIVILVMEILINVKLSGAFGMGGAYAVGLIFLPTIFLAILALDSRNQAVDTADGAGCGYSADDSAEREVSVQPAEEAEAQTSEQKAASALDDAEKAAVTEPIAKEGNRICPFCKAEVSADFNYCPYCRSKLD